MIRRLTLIALAVAAFAVPATASAATAEQVLPNSGADETSGTGTLTLAQPRSAEPQSSGFDWEDAAIGAAGMLSLVVLAGGATTLARRSHKPAPIG